MLGCVLLILFLPLQFHSSADASQDRGVFASGLAVHRPTAPDVIAMPESIGHLRSAESQLAQIGIISSGPFNLLAQAAIPYQESAATDESIQHDAYAIVGGFDIEWLIWIVAAVGLALFLQRRWYRLPSRLNRPAAFTPVFGTASFIAALLAAAVYGSIAMIWMRAGSEDASSAALSMRSAGLFMLGGLVVQILALSPAIVRMSRASMIGGTGRQHGSRASRWRLSTAGLVGVIAIVLWWPLAILAGHLAALLYEAIAGALPEQIAHRTLQEMIQAPRDAWLLLVVFTVTIIVPVVEELLYRGVLQESLRRAGLGPWTAIMLTTVIFVIMHIAAVLPGSPHALASLAVLSIGFGWLYEKTGRLIAPMVLHAAFNGGNALLALLFLPVT